MKFCTSQFKTKTCGIQGMSKFTAFCKAFPTFFDTLQNEGRNNGEGEVTPLHTVRKVGLQPVGKTWKLFFQSEFLLNFLSTLLKIIFQDLFRLVHLDILNDVGTALMMVLNTSGRVCKCLKYSRKVVKSSTTLKNLKSRNAF